MKEKLLGCLKVLNFTPKENSIDVYHKKYNEYTIAIDTASNSIDFGNLISFNNGENHTQKITKDEDFVVLECVDRLLNKGYEPQNITLEKVYPTGHGTSGRLDILVMQNDKAYMMIECKTWGKEFDKAFAKLQKDGGQLFTYFQQDKDAEILVLYASKFDNGVVEYQNQIVKIEEEYRATSNVKDLFDRWNKLPKNNGVFEQWTKPYNYESKALTPNDLIEITQEDSSKIFNRFMEILRHNVVSDKPNAFNKIFTLFLCKIMDEKQTKANEELEFQWLEGIDDHVSFQKRLTDLYQKGMQEFLEKEVTDLSDKEFEEKFGTLDNSIKLQLLEELTKLRLQKSNEFAIKDVFDQETFEENAIVVKEVVELLQGYKIRYTKKQQFLSDFFELLLTTGLKQEVGQFFTPVPIAKFIVRSIPFDKIIHEKLEKGERDELLPNVIDYAVGSGHFITEAMDEIQKYLLSYDTSNLVEDTANEVESWKIKHFKWAFDYVYGIEKDYRLVKTAKVGCYLHGDGLAKVIHGDGLANFTHTEEYKGKLAHSDKNYPQDNKKFDIVVSNPPYSVSAFKNVSKKFGAEDFELYNRLTDQSSEIEALFVERTKQLLKDGGVAGIILPSSLLKDGGLYVRTREMLLKYFNIISITELNSNTFMATGTNTVVLFLQRKNNMVHVNIQNSINKLLSNKQDITINGIEKPLEKYLTHVWENISIEDYFTLFTRVPNEVIKSYDIYKELFREIDTLYSEIIMIQKQDKYKQSSIIKLESKINTIYQHIESVEYEKLLYFILAYPQKVVVVKSGEKKEGKKFLGYEFKYGEGKEGIHSMQWGKSIDECTSLYDNDSYTNKFKANSYIYAAFLGQHNPVETSLNENISHLNLVDMMLFNRIKFEKNISLNPIKKVVIQSKWKTYKLEELIDIVRGASPRPIQEYITEDASGVNWIKIGDTDVNSKYIKKTKEKITSEGAKKSRFVHKGDFVLSNSMSYGRPYIMDIEGCIHDGWLKLYNFDSTIDRDYLYYILSANFVQNQFHILASGGTTVNNLNIDRVKQVRIPIPPKNIQKKIIKEIEALEKKAQTVVIKDLDKQIELILEKYLK